MIFDIDYWLRFDWTNIEDWRFDSTDSSCTHAYYMFRFIDLLSDQHKSFNPRYGFITTSSWNYKINHISTVFGDQHTHILKIPIVYSIKLLLWRSDSYLVGLCDVEEVWFIFSRLVWCWIWCWSWTWYYCSGQIWLWLLIQRKLFWYEESLRLKQIHQ